MAIVEKLLDEKFFIALVIIAVAVFLTTSLFQHPWPIPRHLGPIVPVQTLVLLPAISPNVEDLPLSFFVIREKISSRPLAFFSVVRSAPDPPRPVFTH